MEDPNRPSSSKGLELQPLIDNLPSPAITKVGTHAGGAPFPGLRTCGSAVLELVDRPSGT